MDEPVRSTLLTLLISEGESSVRSVLGSLFEASSDFALAHNELKIASTTEIVFNGVSFIVSVERDESQYSGLKSIFCNVDTASVGCGISIGLGDHVAGGERVPAIIQALLGLAQKLGSKIGAAAVIWHPAKVVTGFAYFSEVVVDYLAGGAFPVLPLVNFKADAGGAIHSRGLATFSGQELYVVNTDLDQIDAMRRVVRVVHDIAVNGSIQQSLELPGIVPGESLHLYPSVEDAILRVEIRRNIET